ncbi:MAG TPA: ATP-binding cassette domain-containing protein [Longilinea sp.]|nr:ATP-binding cassette domain-containing protein [Longilinea sp.]
MINLEHITFGYQTTSPIFQDFSWQSGRGEAWAVLGASGCGKSTLLGLLAGLYFVQSGQVVIDDTELTRPRPQTGLIIQDYGLLPWATVRGNVELGLRVRNFYGPDGTHAPLKYESSVNVNPWLDRLGLLAVAEKYPGQISGGQRQRTAIARTLALRPDLLLMDEPFSSLDAPTREGLQRLMLELWSEQALTLVIVTHSIEEAAVLGQRILLLGRVPNQVSQIIENPGAADESFRESEGYSRVCRMLRERLEDA